MPVAASAVPVAHAEVYQGRWLVKCPWCHSASLASREDHRFFCVGCRNAGVGGNWVNVTWPATPQDIEAPLVMRPDPMTRNWLVTETVADLLAENERYGVI